MKGRNPCGSTTSSRWSDGYPADSISESLRSRIDCDFPPMGDLGYFAQADVFVTSHYGDHPSLNGKAPVIPYMDASPADSLRRWTSDLMHRYIRPRDYVKRKADSFFAEHLQGDEVIGVHIRGTDAVSAQETRAYRQRLAGPRPLRARCLR